MEACTRAQVKVSDASKYDKGFKEVATKCFQT